MKPLNADQSDPPAAPRVVRFDFLEGLRGFLAIYVMLAHLGFFVGLSISSPKDQAVFFPGIAPIVLDRLSRLGGDAVNVFMALSGFVIFHLLSQARETYRAYIIRRFLRLWPVFIVCMILGFFLNQWYLDVLVANPWSHNIWLSQQLEITRAIQADRAPYFLFDLPMLHGLVPKSVLLYAGSAFSSLAWCISTEWQFYLCAPLFFWLAKKPAGMVLFAGAAVYCFAHPGQKFFSHWSNPNSAILPLQLHWFFLGMISYLAWLGMARTGLNVLNRIKFWLVIAAGVAVGIVNKSLIPGVLGWLAVWLALIDLVMVKHTRLAGLFRSAFDHPLSRYFGRISFPIYLIHWPVSIVALKLLIAWYPESSWWQAYLILITAVPLTTWLLAHWTHRFLEAPAMDLGKRLAAKFPRRADAASVDAGQPPAEPATRPI